MKRSPMKRAGYKPKSCKECGDEFTPRNGSQVFCSPDCANEGALEERVCERCDETFKCLSYTTIRFCSKSCANKTSWEKRRMKPRVCETCKQKYQPRADRQRYCSHPCATKGVWERRWDRGEMKHWGVKGKGEDVCRHCGERATHLHHIVPRSKTKLGHRDFRNGLPLCMKCHHGWHNHTVSIWRDDLTKEEQAFAIEINGEYWLERNYPWMPDTALRRDAAIRAGDDPENEWRYSLHGREDDREGFEESRARVKEMVKWA